MRPERKPRTPLAALAFALLGGAGCIDSFERVEIVRDFAGIPNVFAESAEGAFYGLGWATAEDRLFQMELVRRQMRGRLAEAFDPVDFPGALDSDKRARTLGWGVHADRLAASLSDAEARRILRAYANGVNAWVASLGGALPAAFSTVGISSFDAWEPGDSLLAWTRLWDLLDSSWEGEAIANVCPPPSVVDESGAIVPCPSPPAICAARDTGGPRPRPGRFFASPEGFRRASHAWVVSGAASTTGAAVVVGVPQLPIVAPSAWYEFRVRGGDYDARGIGVPGCPGILVGWNSGVAWAATALGTDGGDLFEIDFGAAPNSFVLDGVVTPMTDVRVETILVKNAAAVQVTHRATLFGPVVTPLFKDNCADGPTTGETDQFSLSHVALRDASEHSVQGLLGLMRARDVCEARTALERYRGPSLHVLFGERTGRIGYAAAAAVPNRSSLAPCGGFLAQDGTKLAAAWQGEIPSSDLPATFDPPEGFLVAANNLATPPACAPNGLVLGARGDTIRSWRLREVLAARLQPGAPAIAPSEVLALHTDAVDPALRVFAKIAIAARSNGAFAPGSPEDQAAAALETWNQGLPVEQHWLAVSTSPIFPLLAPLAVEIVQSFRPPLAIVAVYGGGESGVSSFLKTAETDVATAAADPDVLAWVGPALAAAWSAQDPGAASYTVYYQIDGTPLCQSACGGSDGAACAIDPSQDLAVTLTAPLRDTIWSQTGNSYTSFVDLFDVDASRSLLPIGPSEEPSSSFYSSGLTAWLSGGLLAAPLDESLVRATAASVTTLDVP